MCAVHVTVAVCNPGNPEKRWEGLFLVDTGATDSIVPSQYLRMVDITPRGKRMYETADGRDIEMEIGVAQLEFMGEVVGNTVIFGNDDVEPILGLPRWSLSGSRLIPKTKG